MNNNDPLEQLMKESLVAPPDSFTDIVMTIIAQQAPYDYSQRVTQNTTQKMFWPSIALAGSTVLGLFQVIGFIFGLWMPAVAG